MEGPWSIGFSAVSGLLLRGPVDYPVQETGNQFGGAGFF